MSAMGVKPFYEGWGRVQTRLLDRLPALGPEELRLRASSDRWPIWALVSHLAGARVFWLCGIFQEPGAETTPFPALAAPPAIAVPRPASQCWEDQPDHPRSSAELLFAVESSWRIVESCLDRWTPEMLGEPFSREWAGAILRHTRQSVLTRLVMHDAFHAGEVSLVLGMHGRPSLDPWEPPAPAPPTQEAV
jgi:uncharacterized damage-inducible protein DinB